MPSHHLTHARLIFAYTGRTDRWRAAYEKTLPTLNVDRRIMEQFDLLRYQGRFAELRNVLEAERDQTIGAGTFNSLTLCCVGKRPLAEYRGWTALLMNDVEAAGREGREVLAVCKECAAHPMERLVPATASGRGSADDWRPLQGRQDGTHILGARATGQERRQLALRRGSRGANLRVGRCAGRSGGDT